MKIRRTVADTKDGRRRVKNHPKTDAGRRDVALPPMAQDAVADQLQRNLRDGRDSDELLFSSESGAIIWRRIVTDHMKRILRAAGLDTGIRFHDLRHTYATLALSGGIGVHLVSKTIGHSSITMTVDRYGHALPDAKAEAAEIMQNILQPRKKKFPKIS